MNYTENNYPTSGLRKDDVVTFNYTGTYKEISLLPGKYIFECWGAQGGSYVSIGGLGGYTKGTIDIKHKQKFYIYVGEQGNYSGTEHRGGWNGGGSNKTTGSNTGGSGGGASDIRLINGLWNDITSLRSRIMVAGAGGGGGFVSTCGNGGGLNGTTGTITTPAAHRANGTGGTQISGGIFTNAYTDNGLSQTPTEGSFGIGGNGSGNYNYGGAGGGGYYGGGGAADCSGGGGSSFISGLSGCNAIDINGNHTDQPIHYSGILFTNTSTQSGIRSSNGLSKITCIDLYDLALFEVNGEIKYIDNNSLVSIPSKNANNVTIEDFISYGFFYNDITIKPIDLKSLFQDSTTSILKMYDMNTKITYQYIDREEQNDIKFIINKKPIILPYKKINNFFIEPNDTTGNKLYFIQKDNIFYTYRYKYWGIYDFLVPPPIYDKENEENYIINLSNWLNNIDIKDINNMKRYGMSAEMINNIPETNWNELFPYYLNRLRNINFLCMLIEQDDFDTTKLQKIKIYGDRFDRQIFVSTSLYLEEQEKTKYTITWNTTNKNKIKILYGM